MTWGCFMVKIIMVSTMINTHIVVIGFLLILPLTRNAVFKYLGKKYKKEKIKDDLIEGEYEDKDK